MSVSAPPSKERAAAPAPGAGVERVLVGVDGSAGSRRVAAFARDLARAFNAQLTLLHVIERLPMGMPGVQQMPLSDIYSQQMQGAADFMSALAAELTLGDVEQVIEMGYPGDVICQEAVERNVNLIVVGWQGHRPGRRLLMGSVGAHVLATAGCSVTVVH